MTGDLSLFGRQSRITIGTLELTGHRAVFAIEKSIKPEPNTLSLQVYNLSPDHRAQLQELKPTERSTRGIPVKIEAGYSDMSQLWLGDLTTVSSAREGVDWVTTLSSGDGQNAIKNSRIKAPFGPKTDIQTALRAIAKSMGVGLGNLNLTALTLKLKDGGTKLPASKIMLGPAYKVMNDIARSADLEWSIQDGALQFTPRGKALPTQAFVLTPQTGLIGSPAVDNEGVLTAQALMIPDLKVGSIVIVESSSVRGQYRVERATWTGDTHGQDWYVTIQGIRY